MSSSAQIGLGIALKYRPAGSTSGTAFTALGTVMKITPGGVTVGEVESTLLSSTWKTYVPTIPEGEAGSMVRIDKGDTSIISTFRTAISTYPVPTYTFQTLYQDGSYDLFDGFCKSYKPDDYEPEGLMGAQIDLRLNSAPVYYPPPARPPECPNGCQQTELRQQAGQA